MDEARNDQLQQLISQVQDVIDDIRRVGENELEMAEIQETAHQLKNELETLLEDE
jgi:vacuolar-type H+-ATPase subunit D/Vma8